MLIGFAKKKTKKYRKTKGALALCVCVCLSTENCEQKRQTGGNCREIGDGYFY